MRHIVFEDSDSYQVAILIKHSSFNHQDILNNYVKPLNELGIPSNDVIAFNLEYNEQGKAPVKLIKDYLTNLLPELNAIGVKYLYVADANYFKVITGQAKADPHHGYVLPCKLIDSDFKVILGINHSQLIYNPAVQIKLDLSLQTLVDAYLDAYKPLGDDVIHSATYPNEISEIAAFLESLRMHSVLSADFEAFSLKFWKAGIGTVAFAWDEHNGGAFACDYREIPGGEVFVGYQKTNEEVRKLLRNFFETYQGKIIWHNASYDAKVAIYTLWMKDPLDTKGLLFGLETMTKHIHDTKIIAYLAYNSTAGNDLSLKSLAHEFAGNWAVEVKDIRTVPLNKLLTYNLIDALSTYYIARRDYPKMVADQQEDLYYNLMLPSLKLLLQTELTGMPLDPKRVQEVKNDLNVIKIKHLGTINNSRVIHNFNKQLREFARFKDYETRKAKAKNPEKIRPKAHSDFAHVELNPGSPLQLQKLFYEEMKLPVIDRTDTGMPATGADTINKIINHTTNQEYIEVLNALIGYSEVEKILSTFISAFEEAFLKDDGIAWLHGNFNIGGTVSGRLSSSDPNLQNLPAGSTYGKLIKSCFVSTDTWLFCGADFRSLEDYISALTTKDKNKLKVYEEGFDGHCLRAANYFRDQLPHIDLDDPQSVNTIKKTHPHLRQDSKAPTFLLTLNLASSTGDSSVKLI